MCATATAAPFLRLPIKSELARIGKIFELTPDEPYDHAASVDQLLSRNATGPVRGNQVISPGSATIIGETHSTPLSNLVRDHIPEIKQMGYTAIGIEADETFLNEAIRASNDKGTFERFASERYTYTGRDKDEIEGKRQFFINAQQEGIRLLPIDTAHQYYNPSAPGDSMAVRNHAMANTLEKYINEGEKVLYITGAAHTGGPTGVESQLRERGLPAISLDAPDVPKASSEADVKHTATTGDQFMQVLADSKPFTKPRPTGFTQEIDSHGVKRWYNSEGLISSPGDAPAVQYPNGSAEWRKDGVLSREGEPAKITFESNAASLAWYNAGKLEDCNNLLPPHDIAANQTITPTPEKNQPHAIGIQASLEDFDR